MVRVPLKKKTPAKKGRRHANPGKSPKRKTPVSKFDSMINKIFKKRKRGKF